MSVFSARPRVNDLIFCLYDRPIHPELFDIVATRKLRREEYELSVWITQTGHVLSLTSPHFQLTELTACSSQPLPERRCRLHLRMKGEHSQSLPLARDFRYQSSFQIESVSSEIFVHVHDEILADGSKRGLLHHFNPSCRLSLSPLGFVTLEAKRGLLLFSSFHTFPEENTIVKTQSLIEQG